jgi:hypothetical protein
MVMMKKILIACGLSFALAACMGAPDDTAGHEPGEQSVDSVQQTLPSSGWTRTYYSDATRTTTVGYETYDCDPDYRTLEGDRSQWATEYHYDCPEYHTPGFPTTRCVSCRGGSAPYGMCTPVPC